MGVSLINRVVVLGNKTEKDTAGCRVPDRNLIVAKAWYKFEK